MKTKSPILLVLMLASKLLFAGEFVLPNPLTGLNELLYPAYSQEEALQIACELMSHLPKQEEDSVFLEISNVVLRRNEISPPPTWQVKVTVIRHLPSKSKKVK